MCGTVVASVLVAFSARVSLCRKIFHKDNKVITFFSHFFRGRYVFTQHLHEVVKSAMEVRHNSEDSFASKKEDAFLSSISHNQLKL